MKSYIEIAALRGSRLFQYRCRMQLIPHPGTTTITVRSIDVAVWNDADRWHFRFVVYGINGLILPDHRASLRTDELWRHTCFEAFVGLEDDAYLEINFSPSSQWAAYRFDRYRAAKSDEPAEIEVVVESRETWFSLEAAVKCSALTEGSSLGLCAVVEERGGTSYWALAHPRDKPDFHDRACFQAVLTNIAQA